MRLMKVFSFLMVAAVFVACKSSPSKVATETSAPKTAEANLSQVEAERRAALIGDVKYNLNIDVSKPGDKFFATETIEFDVKQAGQSTFLNFKNTGKILAFSLNGVKYSPEFANHRILLESNHLKVGKNVAEIQYEQTYARHGKGLHRFQDREDQRVYLYTQFEAFDAHHMFPSFDQPDLKATMTMTVTTPKTWEVITTTRESAKKTVADTLVWTFPETPRLSTYLFSLHAGPYAKWESKAGQIPLRLFARQSLKKFVNTKEWFVPTQQGFKFFNEYFAYPYPFKKYDQVAVPEFNSGAMENVAAVTFNERFIRRSPSTYKEREGLTNIILHEMAHMWFGDLVTMQWWNGLWLNESFATYMAALASAEATEFKGAWTSFQQSKRGAYILDQQVTTHPIEAAIPDTNSAFANFDAITYDKGASALKQISFYLGADKFRDGVRQYFKTHAYKNTRLQDFLGALEKSSGKDLQSWSKTWLETAGLDTVQAVYSCGNGRITSFALTLQGPNGTASPRTHRTQVTLYGEKGGAVVPTKSESVIYSGPNTDVPQMIGADCPVMVFPNAEDQDYVKVTLDERTLKFAKADLNKVQDTFTRAMIWPNLFSMVRDVALTPQEYLQIVKLNFPGESDLTIGNSILGTLSTLIHYLPKATPAEKKARAEQVQDLERMLWDKLTSAKTPADWKKMLFRTFNIIAESDEARDRLVSVFNEKTKVAGLNIDADIKWEILLTLSSQGDSRMQPLLAKQKLADTSDRGMESSMAVEAIQPSLAVKDQWINKVMDKNMSFAQKRAVLNTILPRTQDELRASLSERYFKTLPDIAASKELVFSNLYTWTLMPSLCTQDSASRLGKFVEEKGGALPPSVLKAMRNGHQEDGRCVRIRAFASVKSDSKT